MNKVLAIIVVSMLALVGFAPTALAQNNFQIENPLEATTIPALIDGVINFIFLVGVAVAPVMIIVGAFYFITAAGDSEQVSKGKRIIIFTLIGIAILYGANILIDVIERILSVNIT